MKLNQVFSHNMVLQAEKRVFVFGEGEGKACVSIDGMKAEASSRNGKWIAELPCHGYGGPYDMNVNLNGEEIVLRNVYFGDVVLLAGQSNLQLKLFETNTPESEYETNSLVRSFILRRPEEGEFYFPEDGWIQAHKDNVGKWPAIGYLAAKEESKRTGHAVGIIGCYQGASMIQSWMPKGILLGTECNIGAEEISGDKRVPEYMLWNHDGFLYEKMLMELVPYALKAVVWYQGESNADTPDNTTPVYKGMLKRLIENWREVFLSPDLEFILIELPDFIYGHSTGWKAVQRAIGEAAQETGNTCLVKSADVCENDHIHPPTKLPLAKRIAECIS